MSKSRGNVVAPDELVKAYGADTVRAYIMFFARWEMGAPWNSQGIEGTSRWIRRVWMLFTDPPRPGKCSDETKRALRRKVHQTLKRVTRDFEKFEFNTIVSSLMELLNEMYKAREEGASGTAEWAEAQDIYLRMMAPVTPHVAEELWGRLQKPYSIHTQPWPVVDKEAAAEEQITLFSLGIRELAGVRDLTGNVHSKDVMVKIKTKQGATKDYRLLMRMYQVQTAGAQKLPSRWVIIKFEAAG
jgi:leucyl-tRNA synthetase